ncbi:MAG: class I SAM-dependent methyltransferase [Nitrosomonadales bacterium]|nr:class I SAM-dependent methyltransferase [Nitrosomonadales bacterium]
MDSIATSPAAACYVCGTAGFPIQTGVTDPDGAVPGEWAFRKCANKECGLVWLDPRPLESELWKAYTAYHTHTRDHTDKAEKLALGLANRLARTVLVPLWVASGLWRETDCIRHMTLNEMPAGKLLDVGCGGGRFMNRMRRRGWDAEGIDFDEKATGKITRRYGMKTYTGDLVACALPGSSYDAITMSHAIEHLYDPENTLKECLRILKPGGKLVVVTPNADSMGAALFGAFWRGWEPPRHLQIFSVKTLADFLHKAGFNINEIRTSSAGAAVIYRVSRTRQEKTGGQLSFLFRLWLVFWSYWKELAEFKAQKSGRHTGQNLLACATRSLGRAA